MATGREPRRPIDADDWNRVYATLSALRAAAFDDEERPVWEYLRELYEDGMPRTKRVGVDDMVGDEAAAREITHALIVVEGMMRGEETIADRPIGALRTVCATPGCPEVTFGTCCLNCEFQRGT